MVQLAHVSALLGWPADDRSNRRRREKRFAA
jgi:hypothetical protein